MMNSIQEPTSTVTNEELQRLADYISSKKLTTPFLFLAEAHRPLRGLAFNTLTISQPLLCLFFGNHNLKLALHTLESDQNFERLLELVESRESSTKENTSPEK
ncbi:MAG: hypothetical protein KDD60_06395 [Bdellovibrionales bacterium]|nr:hypothetical protein [Bdellovibrionales bacterium]